MVSCSFFFAITSRIFKSVGDFPSSRIWGCRPQQGIISSGSGGSSSFTSVSSCSSSGSIKLFQYSPTSMSPFEYATAFGTSTFVEFLARNLCTYCATGNRLSSRVGEKKLTRSGNTQSLVLSCDSVPRKPGFPVIEEPAFDSICDGSVLEEPTLPPLDGKGDAPLDGEGDDGCAAEAIAGPEKNHSGFFRNISKSSKESESRSDVLLRRALLRGDNALESPIEPMPNASLRTSPNEACGPSPLEKRFSRNFLALSCCAWSSWRLRTSNRTSAIFERSFLLPCSLVCSRADSLLSNRCLARLLVASLARWLFDRMRVDISSLTECASPPGS
mmetsp:Transcript_102681/g.162301  ORF Transcript_102681/g.162301 Transcript_102681/m.162301 type:complete len:330 (+) Transcript_102681:874-1863(+)